MEYLMTFIARDYTLPAQRLRTGATAALVRAADLALYASARELLEQARQQAAQIVQQAREDATAEAAASRQHEQAAQAAQRAEDEQQRWASTQQLESGYQALRQQLTQNLETMLDQALTQALQQLAIQTDAAGRLGAVTKALAHSMPNPAGATLWVSGMDAGLLPSLGELPWAVEISPELPSGHCSLIGTGGAWQCDFETLLARVAAPVATPEAIPTATSVGQVPEQA